MIKLQPDTISTQQYQYDYLRTFLRWALVIVSFVVLVYGWIYLQKRVLSIAVTTLAFALLLPLILWGMYLLRRQQLRLATWIALVGALFPATAFTLFSSERLQLVGLIGYILLIRIAIYLETQRWAFVFSFLCLVLYVVTVTLRLILHPPFVDLGQAEVIVLYMLPVLGVMLFTLLDNLGSRYLWEALAVSEMARENLAHSYTQLEEQTQTLIASEAALSTLADRLKKSNEELRRANDEIKSFAYITSHDLRGPLINLKGFAAELRMAWRLVEPPARTGLSELDAVEQEAARQAMEVDVPEALAFIDTAVSRMDGYINALLKLSRLGQRALTFETIDMNEVVAETLQSLAYQIEAQAIVVQTAVLPAVIADRFSISLIIGNLLTNAINYLSPDRPGKINLWAEEEETETIFYVRDNGQGIAAENMHQLFEPFRRIGKHDIAGEGMGLTYVQALVRRHNGRIWCESQKNVGSAFIFTIAKQTNEEGNDE